MSRFYITTPIYYVNAKPHLGHAYTTIVADAVARFHRALGEETYFLTGTDEHGDKIVQAAEKTGEAPGAFTDRVSALFKDLWPRLDITNDDFIRTTEERHKACVRAILQKVYDAGDIYFGEYAGHYCLGCERFLTDKEMVDGKCPDHQTAPELISEKNYFFRMSKYQGWLAEHLHRHPDFIRPERYRNEVLSLLESGALEDLCISRPKSRLSWGIELPFDANFVCYVWFDALLNYVSALGWPDGGKFHKFWPAANHLVAKDILKPHGVFWPCMLQSAGLPVYRHLNVHGYWLVKDTKMSKSLGNVVEPLDLAERYGLDTFRYFLLREMRFGNDASFSEEALVARRNADLANDLGNLASRALSMVQKYFGGVVPEAAPEGEIDEALLELARTSLENYRGLFAEFRFDRALESLWELVRGLNKYIDTSAPWALAKAGDTARLGTVMYLVLELLRKVAVCLTPVMPEAAGKLLAQLGQEPAAANILKELTGFNGLAPGTTVAAGSNLFPRIEAAAEDKAPAPAKARAAEKPAKEKKSVPAPSSAQTGPAESVEYADFAKLDLRVGTVLGVEKHPDADKLLVMQIDCGEGAPRQVVGGLAEFFAPETLVGRQVVVVANLAPRKLRGLESKGMVLAVKKDGGLELLTPSGAVTPGSRVS